MTVQPMRVFIASASEGLDVATFVRDELHSRYQLEAKLWKGSFKPSLFFLESLEAELAQSDFAVLTLTPDDQSISRGQLSMAPRDNVLFGFHCENPVEPLRAKIDETVLPVVITEQGEKRNQP